MQKTNTYTFFVSLSLAARLFAVPANRLLSPEHHATAMQNTLWMHTAWCNAHGIGAFRPMGGAV